MAGYDLEGARQSGVPDSEIANALAPRLNYDLEGARAAGVPDSEIANALALKFNSTGGGAAIGNPSIQRQGEKGIKQTSSLADRLWSVGQSSMLGGTFGALGSEILSGAAKAAGVFPQTARMQPFLESASIGLRNAGRVAPAVAGAVSGALGEAAGQAVDLAGGGITEQELARIAAGSVGPELKNLVALGLKKAAGAAGITDVIEAAKKYIGKDIALNDAQKRYVESEIAALRGGEKSQQPLEQVGSIMGAEGQRLLSESDFRMADALRRNSGVGMPSGLHNQTSSISDIGDLLRDTIVKKNTAELAAREAEITANKAARDAIVKSRQDAGDLIENTPQYKALMAELDLKTRKTAEARMQTPLDTVGDPGVMSDYNVIRDAINKKSMMVTQNEYEKAQEAGLRVHKGTNPQTGEPAFYRDFPTSFEAIENIRRKLGDVFKGKPAEGYGAISEKTARELYGKLSKLQVEYAGGAGGPQAKLLEDYAAASGGLEKFSSKIGKKATALDQYREGQYANDASTLPAAYFKTRSSIKALKELTGDPAKVDAAALAYADNALAGKNADQARDWIGKNNEWLSETGVTRNLVSKYVARLEDSERAVRNAQDFAAKAKANSSILLRDSLPAQRAVDLIKGGDVRLWDVVAPVVAKSPQAKQQMVSAVRQVVADQATAKGTSDLFSRNIRPFLEKSGIASTDEMNFIAQKLKNIQEMNVPEPEKLGLAKRLLLQGSAGWAAEWRSKAWEIPE